MIGPSITGVLIAAFGGTVGFGLAAASSAMALVMYGQLRVNADAPAPSDQRLLRQLFEGLDFVARDFVFAALICLALFNAVFGLSYVTLLPIFSDVYFQTGSAGYGLLAAVGFSNTFYLTQVSTQLQQTVPDHLRGRVMSLYALCWNLLPIGGLLGGVMAAAVEARFAVLVGGAMVAGNALLLLASRRLRLL